MTLSYENMRKDFVIFKNINLKKYSHLLIYKKWRFFYSFNGDGSPLDTTSSNNKEIPDYVELMLYKFETAKILLNKSFGLRDPLSGGFFYEKGAKFIDIYIDNIPREHGLASSIVYDEKFDILENTQYKGKSLKITIHKNLVKKTVTPIHELFHLFQYSYAHFNNMWYMEGLARWSQSIMQEKTGKLEPLPKNEEELDILVHKLHDAEFFFNNLITLVEEKTTFEIPLELANNSEIYNNKKTGATFMRLFLQNCEIQYKLMQKKSKSRDLKDVEYWSRDEKRSTNNNQYIFKAILDTIEKLDTKGEDELTRFVNLIDPLAHINIDDFDTKDIQNFLKVIQKLNKDFVIESDSGILYSEFYDIFTGTFSAKELNFTNNEIDDDELDSFKILRRVNGSLIFNNCKNITTLNGLRNLVLVEGDLILSNINLSKLNELNNLVSVGKLTITKMDNLKSINGLNELVKIKSNLLLSENINLDTINGLNSLNSVKNIEIRSTNLRDCTFLKRVFNTNKEFNGFVKIWNNKLENIEFMKGIKTIKSSLFLHQNKLINLDGLEDLKYVGGSLSLSSNKLNSITALKNLTQINGLLALSYNKLTSLDGLQNLKSLTTKKWSNHYFTIKFYANNQLKDISALSNIQTKDNYLIIYFDSHIEYVNRPDEDSNFHKNILELHDYKTKKIIPTYKFVSKQKYYNKDS